MNEIPRANRDLEKEIAREATELTNNRAFMTAVKALKQQWQGQMLANGLTVEQILEFRAQLRVLEAIPAMLSSMMLNPEFMKHGRR